MYPKLSDIYNISLGYSIRQKPEEVKHGDCYLVQPNNINDYGIIEYHTCIKIDTTKSNYPKISKGDILLTNKGKIKSAVFNSYDDYTTISSLFILTLKREYINIYDNEYISLWLNSSAGQKQLLKYSDCTTTNSLSRKALDYIVLRNIPDIEKQKRITMVNKLNAERFIIEEKLYNLRKLQINTLVNGGK